MNIIGRVPHVAILFGALFVAGFARAGEVNGKVSATGLKSAENIAVYIDAIPGTKFDPPAEHVSVDQRNLKFTPHTTVILRGTTADFLNTAHFPPTVYSPPFTANKTPHPP